MKVKRKKQLEKDGWKFGGVQEFLGLTDTETVMAEIRAALAVCLQQHRKGRRISQVKLAERIGTTQARIARMENAEPSVSLEAYIKALRAVGATMPKISAVLATRDPAAMPQARYVKMVDGKEEPIAAMA